MASEFRRLILNLEHAVHETAKDVKSDSLLTVVLASKDVLAALGVAITYA